MSSSSLPCSRVSTLGNVTTKEFRLHLTLKKDLCFSKIIRTDNVVWYISDGLTQLNIKIDLEEPKVDESLPQYLSLLCLGSYKNDEFVVLGHRNFYNFYTLPGSDHQFKISQTDKLFCPLFANQMMQQLVFVFQIVSTSQGLIPTATMKIESDAEFMSTWPRADNTNKENYAESNPTKLLSDLGSMLDNAQLSDATLVVIDYKGQSRDFKVHKAILSARSPVFATKFKPERVIAVTDTGRICKLIDLTPEIVQLEDFADMLRYIYTGQVASVQERNLDGLMYLAKEYQLSDLEEACKKQMTVIINPDSAPALLIDADRKNASWQKKLLIEYIIENLNLVIGSKGYSTMVKSHPHLLDEILRIQAQKLTNKRSQQKPTKDGDYLNKKFKM